MRKLIVHTLLGFFGSCLLARASAIPPSDFVVPSSTVDGYAVAEGTPYMQTNLTNPGGGSASASARAGFASLTVALSTYEQSVTADAEAYGNVGLGGSLDQAGALAAITYYVIVAPGNGAPSSGTVPVLINTSLDTQAFGTNPDGNVGSATATVEEFGLLLQAQSDSDGNAPTQLPIAETSQVVPVEVGAVNEIYMYVNLVAFGGETAIADIDPTFTIEGSDAQSYQLLYSPEISTETAAPEPASFYLTGLLLLAGGTAWRRKKSA